MSFETTNPVAIGDATKKSHYDTVFNNTQLLERCIYNAIASSTEISNTSSPSSFSLTKTLSAGILNSAGTILRVRASGKHSTTGTPTFQFFGAVGAFEVFDSGPLTAHNNAANDSWEIEFELIVRTTGASADVLIGTGRAQLKGGENDLNVHTGTGTLDLTGTLAVEISVQMSAADPSNKITMTQLTIELIPTDTTS